MPGRRLQLPKKPELKNVPPKICMLPKHISTARKEISRNALTVLHVAMRRSQRKERDRRSRCLKAAPTKNSPDIFHD